VLGSSEQEVRQARESHAKARNIFESAAGTARGAMTETHLSLLQRATTGDDAAWAKMVALYQPLIYGWLHRHAVPRQEAADLTQEVLVAVVRELSSFAHAGHPGSFRGWLRAITVNRARAFLRGATRERAAGGDGVLGIIDQLEDPQSAMTQAWNAEHDAHVVRQILQLIETDFEPATVRVFHRLVLDEARASEVAAEMEMTVAAVYAAKSRVLQRVRQEAEGLLD
jgi:RNA polymerase sigma-70 factor (ECF subfamily)